MGLHLADAELVYARVHLGGVADGVLAVKARLGIDNRGGRNG